MSSPSTELAPVISQGATSPRSRWYIPKPEPGWRTSECETNLVDPISDCSPWKLDEISGKTLSGQKTCRENKKGQNRSPCRIMGWLSQKWKGCPKSLFILFPFTSFHPFRSVFRPDQLIPNMPQCAITCSTQAMLSIPRCRNTAHPIIVTAKAMCCLLQVQEKLKTFLWTCYKCLSHSPGCIIYFIFHSLSHVMHMLIWMLIYQSTWLSFYVLVSLPICFCLSISLFLFLALNFRAGQWCC